MVALQTGMERGPTGGTARPRKKRGEGHTRRDEILSAAKALFLHEGYQATTIRRIADAVGVSAPALYLYFKDKEAIMLALCDQTFGFLLEDMAAIGKQGLAPLDRLRRCGEAYIRFALGNPQEYWLTFLSGNLPRDVKHRASEGQSIDPGKPGAGGTIAFGRLVSIFHEIEAAETKLFYTAETSAELVWMGLHGLVAAMINTPGLEKERQDELIVGMLDMVIRGVVKAQSSLPIQMGRWAEGPEGS
jgi:AcrR family transcriptional regulator